MHFALFIFCLTAFLSEKNIFNKYISLSFLITVTSSLILTTSRSAWLGLLLFIPFMTGSSSLVWFLPLISIGTLCVILANANFIPEDLQNLVRNFLPKYFWLKFSAENYTVGITRPEIWGQALFYISQKPIFGWGAASFPLLYLASKAKEILHSHNLIFELAISYGLPITIMIFGAIFTICIAFTHLYKDISIKKISLWDKAWFSSFFILLTSQLIDIQYFDGRISFLFWLLLAGLKELISSKNQTQLNLKNHYQ